jgi:hypothetical protein
MTLRSLAAFAALTLCCATAAATAEGTAAGACRATAAAIQPPAPAVTLSSLAPDPKPASWRTVFPYRSRRPLQSTLSSRLEAELPAKRRCPCCSRRNAGASTEGMLSWRAAPDLGSAAAPTCYRRA